MSTKKLAGKITSRTTVRLPEDVHTLAKVAASRSRVKLQDFVAAAVNEKLLRDEIPEPKRKRA
jgi:predicted HicB family RNase H-like nuclease